MDWNSKFVHADEVVTAIEEYISESEDPGVYIGFIRESVASMTLVDSRVKELNFREVLSCMKQAIALAERKLPDQQIFLAEISDDEDSDYYFFFLAKDEAEILAKINPE